MLKRAMARILLLIYISTVGAFTCFAAVITDGTNVGLSCDANSDGVIDIRDLVRTKKFITGSSVEITFVSADLNSDNVINSEDIVIICKYLLSPNDEILTEGYNW